MSAERSDALRIELGRTFRFRIRDFALRLPPWGLLLLAITAVSLAGASDSTVNRVTGAALALIAAVIGYLHNEAGPYRFESSNWAKTEKPPREGTDRPELGWELVVPSHWVRGRAAFLYLEENGLLTEVHVDVTSHADGTLHIEVGGGVDRVPPGGGEVRFGG